VLSRRPPHHAPGRASPDRLLKFAELGEPDILRRAFRVGRPLVLRLAGEDPN
jgi:hypothetical protein